MFHRVLVPLDGSEFAERALEPAFAIAQKFGSEVLLLRVAGADPVEVRRPRTILTTYDLREASQEEAEGYLYGIKMRWLGSGVPMCSQVLTGTAPEMIATVAKEAGVDMIVMSTHGRSGVSRLLYGSVAEAVLRGVHVPIVLVPFKGQAEADGRQPKQAGLAEGQRGGPRVPQTPTQVSSQHFP